MMQVCLTVKTGYFLTCYQGGTNTLEIVYILPSQLSLHIILNKVQLIVFEMRG